MSNDDYTNDPAFYLTIAGGCSTLVCCLVCIAKHWDDPPDWFPKQLKMYHREHDELLEAKELYSERAISFLDYFFKRLDTYYICEMPTFIKYYRGVDLEKYKDKIRKITNDFPHLNEKGEVI